MESSSRARYRSHFLRRGEKISSFLTFNEFAQGGRFFEGFSLRYRDFSIYLCDGGNALGSIRLNGYSFDIPWNIYNIRERERVKSRNGFRYDKAAVGKSLNN